MIQFHTVDLNEVKLHYAEAPGPGPVLLLVHGSTGSHTAFLPFIPTLAQYAHVYALDLRGHNLSGRAPGAYQVPDYGRDVIAFLRTVTSGRAIVAGHSLGGLVAVWAAGETQELVSGIFLEDPPLYMAQYPRFLSTGFYHYFVHLSEFLPQHHARGGTLDEMIGYVSQAPANAAGQTLLELAGDAAVRERAVQLHNLDPATLEPLTAGGLLGDRDADELLAQVRCPVRLLAGESEAGGAMDAQDVVRAAAHLAHCEQTVFSGVGHMIHQERPDEYVGALIAFLAKASQTGPNDGNATQSSSPKR